MCDIRVFCHKCAQDIRNAGYVLKRIGYIKEECDKCNRQGYSYILTKKRESLTVMHDKGNQKRKVVEKWH